jgi:hypothetical protein
MTKTARITIVTVGAVAMVLTILVCALFRGYFDPGLFAVQELNWSPSKQVAIVVKRSDHEALNGDTYFVLIASHLLSSAELRHAYHGPDVVFAADGRCVSAHWGGAHTLIVSCSDSSIGRDDIDTQQRKSGDITISYVNIPIK